MDKLKGKTNMGRRGFLKAFGVGAVVIATPLGAKKLLAGSDEKFTKKLKAVAENVFEPPPPEIPSFTGQVSFDAVKNEYPFKKAPLPDEPLEVMTGRTSNDQTMSMSAMTPSQMVEATQPYGNWVQKNDFNLPDAVTNLIGAGLAMKFLDGSYIRKIPFFECRVQHRQHWKYPLQWIKVDLPCNLYHYAVDDVPRPQSLEERGSRTIKSNTFQVTSRKLRAQWSPEAFEDMKPMRDVDPQKEFAEMMSYDIMEELYREYEQYIDKTGKNPRRVIFAFYNIASTPVVFDAADFRPHRSMRVRHAIFAIPDDALTDFGEKIPEKIEKRIISDYGPDVWGEMMDGFQDFCKRRAADNISDDKFFHLWDKHKLYNGKLLPERRNEAKDNMKRRIVV